MGAEALAKLPNNGRSLIGINRYNALVFRTRLFVLRTLFLEDFAGA